MTKKVRGINVIVFQFLIGRLDTVVLADGLIVGHMFQFLIGRLDTGGSSRHNLGLGAVSIPHR